MICAMVACRIAHRIERKTRFTHHCRVPTSVCADRYEVAGGALLWERCEDIVSMPPEPRRLAGMWRNES